MGPEIPAPFLPNLPSEKNRAVYCAVKDIQFKGRADYNMIVDRRKVLMRF